MRAAKRTRKVPRRRAENAILVALRKQLLQPEVLRRVMKSVEREIRRSSSSVPEILKQKTKLLNKARRRVDRIVGFIVEGGGTDSRALREDLAKSEASVDVLAAEVDALQRSRESVFRVPSREWIAARVSKLRDILERRTEASALLLRRLLGKIELQPMFPEEGRPFYVAKTSLDVLALLEAPDPGGSGTDPDSGSGGNSGPGGGDSGSGGGLALSSDSGANVQRWWRRRESNPRPRIRPHGTLHACPRLLLRPRRESAAKTAGG